MTDSTNGRSSFWTQADALLRKNLIFQASRVELLDEVQVRAIQDIKGKEWTFQFRFWPNNNSRMYVLEGVTPCIQNMQLQADDTVTFSRIDPGGQPVIGCCKATNNVDVQGQKSKEWITLGYSSSLPYVDGWIGVFLPANFRTSS